MRKGDNVWPKRIRVRTHMVDKKERWLENMQSDINYNGLSVANIGDQNREE